MSQPTRRIAPVLAIAALALAALVPLPTQAQCLSNSECDALKAQLMDLKGEARGLRVQLREIRLELRGTPAASPERESLRDRARALRRQIRDLRKEARPTAMEYRRNCKNC